MMGRSHRVSGIAVGLGLGAYLNVPLAMLPVIVAATAIGSLVPDIDHPGSTVSRSLGPATQFLSWIVRRGSERIYADTKGPRDEDWRGGHRHASHTAVFAAVLGAVLYLALNPWLGTYWALVLSGALALGCLTHDIGDSLTLMGCPFLFPLKIRGETWYELRPPRILRFRTGGWVENYVVFPALCVAAVLLIPGVWPVAWATAELLMNGRSD